MNQILLMDPLTSMSQAYALLLQIKQQKKAHLTGDLGTFNIDNNKGGQIRKPFDKKNAQMDKGT